MFVDLLFESQLLMNYNLYQLYHLLLFKQDYLMQHLMTQIIAYYDEFDYFF